MTPKDVIRIVLLMMILASIFGIFFSVFKASRGLALITGSTATDSSTASGNHGVFWTTIIFTLVLAASMIFLSRLNRH